MAALQFSSWRRSKIVSGSQPQGGRLVRSLSLTLDDTGDQGPASSHTLRVAFPAAADIQAISAGAIRHMAPKPDTPDAETTKFVHLDFHDPELPWRYTPMTSAAGNSGLKPWMVLIVGTKDELEVTQGLVTRVDNNVLSDHNLENSHRWAHVQKNDGPGFSRILSPRVLKPLQDYVAALVPAFTADGGDMWAGAQRNFDILPAYFSWRFQCAEEGDFETLSAALKLQSAEGIGIAKLRYNRPVARVDERLTLGGALTSLKIHPDEQLAVGRARNDLDDLNNKVLDDIPGDIIPPPPKRDIVQMPDYGRLWREDTSAAKWTKSLNDDPRHRGVAGIGLKLGKIEQEPLMSAAVAQAGALQDAAQRIGFLALGIDVSKRLWNRRLPKDAALRLRVFGPAMGRMAAEGGGSVLERVTGKDSALDAAVFSSAAQRLLRNGSARGRHSGGRIDRAAFLAAANQTPLPPEKTPEGLPHVDLLARLHREPPLEEVLGLPDFGGRLEEIIQNFDGAPVDEELVKKFVRTVDQELGVGCHEISDYLGAFITNPPRYVFQREMILEAIETCLAQGDGEQGGLSTALPRPAGPDGRRPISLDALAGAVAGEIDPNAEEPPALVRVQSTVTGIEPFSLSPPEAPIGLDYPTWSMVKRHEPDWLLPGAAKIKPDSIVPLQTNQSFVDAFMVGINTQFLAEMRWRNLPAPRVSTPLRMFWGYMDHSAGKREADIRPIADWPSKAPVDLAADDIGDAAHQWVRPGSSGVSQKLVIAMRTALFRRYPSTLVYLVRPQPGDDPDALLKAPPNFMDGAASPATQRFLGPIFPGQIEPDLVFFIFDANPAELGSLWLVLDEPPSELRFRNDKPLTHVPDTSADFAAKTIDEPTRVAISGRTLMDPAGLP